MSDTLLNYRMSGEGHPVLFLHGFLESITMWKPLEIDKFNFQSVQIDLPGHGSSLNEDDQEPSVDYMADKVMEVVHRLGITRFSVVGHSMGGYVALLLKKKSQEEATVKCDKVVLLNSNFWEDSESKKTDRLRVADIVLKNKNLFIREAIPNLFVKKEKFPKEIEALLQEALKIDSHAIAYASLAMRNRKSTKNVVYHSPQDFLVIQGEIDSIVPVEIMKEELAGTNIQLEILPETGHMAHFESTDSVRKLIIEFLN